jgi:hypothetical protein
MYPHARMPPYQNDSLHDMHALMQQLDTLNAAHEPEHLEMFEGLINKIKSTERGKKMMDGVTKLMGKDVDAEAVAYEAANSVEQPDIHKENSTNDILLWHTFCYRIYGSSHVKHPLSEHWLSVTLYKQDASAQSITRSKRDKRGHFSLALAIC